MKVVTGVFCLLVLGAGTALAAEPVDGRLVGNQKTYWDSPNYNWWQKTQPSNGGILYLDKGSATIEARTANVQLGGIVIRNTGTDIFWNKPFTLVGDEPTLTVGNLARADTYCANANGTFGLQETTMKGTGSNTFVMKGDNLATPGLRLDRAYLTDFAALRLEDGFVTALVTNDSIVVSAAPIALGDVGLSVSCPYAEATSVTSGALTVKGNVARLDLDKSKATTLAYTAADLTLDPDTPAATFAIRAASGLAALGSTEIFRLRTAPATSWVSPAIVGMDGSTADKANPVKFLKYDATQGFIVDPDVPSIAAATTVSEDVTYANGLTVDGAATLTFANGAKLKIGDGTKPAGLAFNFGAAASGATYVGATGDGAFDFGGQDAYIWFTCYSKSCDANRNGEILIPITNARNVHLVGRFWGTEYGQYDQPLIRLASSGHGWTGDLYVSGVRLVLNGDAQFPATCRICVTGNQKAGGGQLYPAGGYYPTAAFANELVLSGHGMYSADAAGAFDGGMDTKSLFAPVTLADDATVNCQKGNLYLKGPIGGTGALTLTSHGTDSSSSRQIHLCTNNTYAGATYIENLTLFLDQCGTFGTGPVVVRDATRGTSKLTFNVTNLSATVGNDITGDGVLQTPGSSAMTNLTLAGRTEAVHLILNQTDVPSVTVKDLAVDTLPSRNDNAIRAVDGESVLRIGRATTASDLRASLSDGDGRLTLVKKGDNTLTLVGPQRHTGGTIVSNGTLKLVAQADFPLRHLCSFHLDASDESTITTDDSGRVTEWRSVEGAMYYDGQTPTMVSAGTFNYKSGGVTQSTSYGLPKYVASSAFGGRKVVRFETNTIDRLRSTRDTKNRTVFIVANITQPDSSNVGGFFGKYGVADFGLRLSSESSFAEIYGQNNWGYAFYVTHDYLYCNAVQTKTFTRGTPQVYTLGRFPFTPAAGGNTPDSAEKVTFPITLGGYFNENREGVLKATRPIGYEVAEVIILKDNVSDSDRKLVEDYLAQKWLGTTFGGTSFTPQTTVLHPAGALTVAENATVDLNGADQTVASLSGVGTILNSSATPVTLTVTGTSDFRGEVKGSVTLALSDGAAAVHVSGGASLGTTGAGGADGATVGAYPGYYYEIPTNGIVYWLDAALPETVVRDDDGYVTNWTTRAPGTVSFNSKDNPEATFVASGVKIPPPVYRTGDGGWGDNQKPGVYFGANTTADPKVATLRSEKSLNAPKTIFLVASADGNANYSVCPGIWSPKCSGDCGLRWSGQDQSSFDHCGYAFYFFLGDSVRVNGTERVATASGVPTGFNTKVPLLVSGRALGSWHNEGSNTHALGCYYDSILTTQRPRGMKGWISEVIAYNRILTDDEVAYVEKYLNAKWFTADGLPDAHTSIFGDDAEKKLTVKVTDKAVSPITLSGDFDATGWTLVVDDYRALGRRNPRPAVPIVKVTDGAATGTFTTNVQSPWNVEFSSGLGWTLGYRATGLAVILK